MGRDTGSRAAYTAVVDRAAQMGSATRDAEQAMLRDAGQATRGQRSKG